MTFADRLPFSLNPHTLHRQCLMVLLRQPPAMDLLLSHMDNLPLLHHISSRRLQLRVRRMLRHQFHMELLLHTPLNLRSRQLHINSLHSELPLHHLLLALRLPSMHTRLHQAHPAHCQQDLPASLKLQACHHVHRLAVHREGRQAHSFPCISHRLSREVGDNRMDGTDQSIIIQLCHQLTLLPTKATMMVTLLTEATALLKSQMTLTR